MYSIKGQLLAVDFYLENWFEWHEMEKIFADALSYSGMSIINKTLHKFEPQGETCVWLLEESHMAVHTYPENAYFAIDVFTCGIKAKPMKTIEYLTKKLSIKTVLINKITRGTLK